VKVGKHYYVCTGKTASSKFLDYTKGGKTTRRRVGRNLDKMQGDIVEMVRQIDVCKLVEDPGQYFGGGKKKKGRSRKR